MTRNLDRADIQGNVLLPYSRNTFPIGHLLLFHVQRDRQGLESGEAARDFLRWLLPQISNGDWFESKRTRLRQGGQSRRLPPPPPVAVNVAFTRGGLESFGVPPTTLNGFPSEFLEGMHQRAAMLHDDPGCWDPAWLETGEHGRIDLAVFLRVNVASALHKRYRLALLPPRAKSDYHSAGLFREARTQAWRRLRHRSCLLIAAAEQRGLRVLAGHGPASDPDAGNRLWLETESLIRTRAQDGVLASPGHPDDRRYGEYEHFGFFDGIADPVFEGQYPDDLQAEELIGQGRREGGRWLPLATGEFLLGHPDEAQETPASPVPSSFSRNGTFLVVRKLHQHVARFERAIAEQRPRFQSWLGTAETEAEAAAARLLMRAKLVGRWDDGTPLEAAPSYEAWQAFRDEYRQLLDAAATGNRSAREELDRFRRQFRDLIYEPTDPDGGRCPFTSHIRRSNPRDSGDPRLPDHADEAERRRAGSVLVNRRRILRRGMTYGEPWSSDPPDSRAAEACKDDGRERGTLFMALCAGIARQFEFLQQQWLNYGADFGAGNDACPISGVLTPEAAEWGSKLIVASPPDGTRPPFVMRPDPAPVECRGGGYFFLPSLTALRQMAQGMVDPL